MRHLVVPTLALVLWFAQGSARAGTADYGTVSYVHAMPNGVVLFSTSGYRDSPPSCATIPGRFAVNGTTPAGKLQVGVILSAHAQGKPLAVFGYGTCADWGDTESVNFVIVR